MASSRGVLGSEKQLSQGLCGPLLEVRRDARVVLHGGIEGPVAHAHLRHARVDVQHGVEGGVGSPELPEVEGGIADLCRERLEGPLEHVVATLGGAYFRREEVAVFVPGGDRRPTNQARRRAGQYRGRSWRAEAGRRRRGARALRLAPERPTTRSRRSRRTQAGRAGRRD